MLKHYRDLSTEFKTRTPFYRVVILSTTAQWLSFDHEWPRIQEGTDLKVTCINYSLKEQCHEDFAVLRQFGAKIITLRL